MNSGIQTLKSFATNPEQVALVRFSYYTALASLREKLLLNSQISEGSINKSIMELILEIEEEVKNEKF